MTENDKLDSLVLKHVCTPRSQRTCIIYFVNVLVDGATQRYIHYESPDFCCLRDVVSSIKRSLGMRLNRFGKNCFTSSLYVLTKKKYMIGLYMVDDLANILGKVVNSTEISTPKKDVVKENIAYGVHATMKQAHNRMAR